MHVLSYWIIPYLIILTIKKFSSKRQRLFMERHDHDQKVWLDADLIGLYNVLSKSASDHLTTILPLVLIKPFSDNILMCGMQHIEDNTLL